MVEDLAADGIERTKLDSAVEPLVRAGLAVRIASASPARVVGGRRAVIRNGLKHYEDGFALWREPDGTFHAGVAGRGNLGTQIESESLEAAVAFLLDQYKGQADQKR